MADRRCRGGGEFVPAAAERASVRRGGELLQGQRKRGVVCRSAVIVAGRFGGGVIRQARGGRGGAPELEGVDGRDTRPGSRTQRSAPEPFRAFHRRLA